MKHAPGCWPRKRGQHVGNVLGGVKRVQYISPVSARVASIVSPASEAAPPAMVEGQHNANAAGRRHNTLAIQAPALADRVYAAGSSRV
jgi:hypothetical protein